MPPFTLSTTGTSTVTSPADLATLSLSIADTARTPAEALALIAKTALQIEKMLLLPKPGLVSWSKSATPRTHFDARGSSSKVATTAQTGFVLVFDDVELLGTWCAALRDMERVSVDGIVWSVRPDTLAGLSARGRAACARDARAKAVDYAEAMGWAAEAVRPLELKDAELKVQVSSKNGSRGLGRREGAGSASSGAEPVVGEVVVFAREEVSVVSGVGMKFVCE